MAVIEAATPLPFLETTRKFQRTNQRNYPVRLDNVRAATGWDLRQVTHGYSGVMFSSAMKRV